MPGKRKKEENNMPKKSKKAKINVVVPTKSTDEAKDISANSADETKNILANSADETNNVPAKNAEEIKNIPNNTNLSYTLGEQIGGAAGYRQLGYVFNPDQMSDIANAALNDHTLLGMKSRCVLAELCQESFVQYLLNYNPIALSSEEFYRNNILEEKSKDPYIFTEYLRYVINEKYSAQKNYSTDPHLPACEFIQILGDGNCLYSAVLRHLDGMGYDVKSLREMVAQYLRLLTFSSELQPVLFACLKEGETLEDRYRSIENGTQWADDLEIMALMACLKRPIFVVHFDGTISHQDAQNSFPGQKPIYVYYNGIDHYNALIVSSPKEFETALKARTESFNLDPWNILEILAYIKGNVTLTIWKESDNKGTLVVKKVFYEGRAQRWDILYDHGSLKLIEIPECQPNMQPLSLYPGGKTNAAADNLSEKMEVDEIEPTIAWYPVSSVKHDAQEPEHEEIQSKPVTEPENMDVENSKQVPSVIQKQTKNEDVITPQDIQLKFFAPSYKKRLASQAFNTPPTLKITSGIKDIAAIKKYSEKFYAYACTNATKELLKDDFKVYINNFLVVSRQNYFSRLLLRRIEEDKSNKEKHSPKYELNIDIALHFYTVVDLFSSLDPDKNKAILNPNEAICYIAFTFYIHMLALIQMNSSDREIVNYLENGTLRMKHLIFERRNCLNRDMIMNVQKNVHSAAISIMTPKYIKSVIRHLSPESVMKTIITDFLKETELFRNPTIDEVETRYRSMLPFFRMDTTPALFQQNWNLKR